MSLIQILPILVPGILVQLAIQIYYIKHCWENPLLSQKQKVLWIVMIALFNLPATAVYLILTREKPKIEVDYRWEKESDRNIKQAISVLLYLFFMVLTITVLFNNYKRPDFNIMALLLGINLILIVLSWLFSDKKFRALHYIIPVLSLAVAAYINYMDEYSTTTLIVLAVAANIINNHNTRVSRIYGVIGFFVFVGLETAGLYRGGATVTTDELVGFVYLNAVIYILVLMAFYLLKRQLILNVRLKELVDETTEKSKALEEMTAISERNKIAGEIHDTVGHTLTTAIISLDAALGQIGLNNSGARDSVSLARQQIRKGMDDIRYSVRAIKHGAEGGNFNEAFSGMLAEMEKTTGIKINAILETNENIIPIHRNLIYRVAKECITNSVKHSECTEADILMSESGGILNFTYTDNGKGTDNIKEGFGLSNIREMTEAMGGRSQFISSAGEGFTINLRIPTGREAG